MAETVVEIFIRAKDETTKVVKAIQQEVNRTAGAVNKLDKKGTKKLNQDLSATGDVAKKSTDSVRSLDRSLDSVDNTNFNDVRAAMRRLVQDTQAARVKAKELGDAFRNTGQSLREASLAAGGFGAALAAPGAIGLKTFASFEKTLARVKAVTSSAEEGLTSISEVEFQTLTEQAQRLGETTQFTANEAAQALVFLGQAGLNAAEANEALPEVLQLAAAGVLDLAEAGDIATNVLTGLGLEVDQLNRVNDVLVSTANSANTDVRQLGEALKNAAPAAAAVGLEIEEITGFLGAFAQAGFRGGEAGNTLKRILISVSKPTKKAQDALDRLGVSVRNSNGSLRDLDDILEDLNDANLTLEDSARIFGLYSASAALAGVRNVELAREIRDTNKAADEQNIAAANARLQLDNLAGDTTKLASAVEGLFLAIGGKLAPVVRTLVQALTSAVQFVTRFLDALGPLGDALVIAVTGLGAVVLVLATLGGALSLAISGIGSLIAGLGGAATFIAGFTGGLTGLIATLRILAPLLKGLVGLPAAAIVGFEVGKQAVTALAEAFPDVVDELSGMDKAFTATKDGSRRSINQIKKDLDDLKAKILPVRKAIASLADLELDFANVDQQRQFDLGLKVLEAEVISGRVDSTDAVKQITDFKNRIIQAREDIVLAERRLEAARVQESKAAQNQIFEDAKTNIQKRIEEEKKLAKEYKREEQEIVAAIKRGQEEIIAGEKRFADRRKSINEEAGRRLQSLEDRRADVIRSALPEAVQQKSLEAEATNKIAEALTQVQQAETEEQLVAAQGDLDRASALSQQIQDTDVELGLIDQLVAAGERLRVKRQEVADAEGAAFRTEAEDNLVELRGDLEEVRTGIAATEEALKNFKGILKDLEKPVEISVEAQTAVAVANVEALKQELEELKNENFDKTITITVRTEEASATGGFAGRTQGFTPGFAKGGKIPGYGGGDKVNALLERGEFIVRKDRARMFASMLQFLNSSPISKVKAVFSAELPKFKLGGMVPDFDMPRFQTGGLVDSLAADNSGPGVSDRIAVDLSVGGQGIGDIFGERETVDKLLQALGTAGRTSVTG